MSAGAKPRAPSQANSLRALVVSRFGHALLAEADKHGGIHEYRVLLSPKLSDQTFRSWALNARKPTGAYAARLVEVSPELRPHLEERGCFRRRPMAAAPITAAAQTTETANRQHSAAIDEAQERATKLERLSLIRKRHAARTRKPHRSTAHNDSWTAKYYSRTAPNHDWIEQVADIAVAGADVVPAADKETR